MKITRDIKPVTYLKSRTKELLEQINETRSPVIITQNGEPRAVLQDPKSYEECATSSACSSWPPRVRRTSGRAGPGRRKKFSRTWQENRGKN